MIYIQMEWLYLRKDSLENITLTLKVLVTIIDALRHF